MSSDAVIKLRGAGKCYNLYDKPSDRLKQMLANRLPASRRRRYYTEHWAVRRIDLDIARGETVGIIGANGSGKSTLLQIICGTLTPTEGEIGVRGRIAPLLQLGAGFNPEFTGRENVYLNAAILGLPADEIATRFEAIVAFADIGDMLQRPVKHYSSGMYARLAFAVAINVDPDILVVDEALAVGDEAFQRKCFGRIEAIRCAGATVLFVSHASAVVQELCNRVVFLDRGELLQIGEPKIVIQNYQRLMFAPASDVQRLRNLIKSGEPIPAQNTAPTAHVTSATAFDPSLVPKSTIEYARRGAAIRNVRIRDANGEIVNILDRHQTYWYEYEVGFDRPMTATRFAMLVKTITGFELAGQWSSPKGQGIDVEMPGATYRIRLPLKLPFASGVYFANAGVWGQPPHHNEPIMLHRIIDAVMFRVLPVSSDRIACYVDITAGSPSIELATDEHTIGG